MIAIKIGRF